MCTVAIATARTLLTGTCPSDGGDGKEGLAGTTADATPGTTEGFLVWTPGVETWEADSSRAWDLKVAVAWLKNRAVHRGANIMVAPGWSQAWDESTTWQNDKAVRGSLNCSNCAGKVVALLRHGSCGHTACVRCWAEELPERDGWPCARANCRRCRNGCLACRSNTQGLTAFPGACSHSACGACWDSWLTQEVARSRLEKRDGLRCIVPGCTQEIHTYDSNWGWLCAMSPAVRDLNNEIALARGRPLAEFAPPLQPGIVCSICCEPQWSLIGNVSCRHHACETCWVSWAIAQLPGCEARRRDQIRCIACTHFLDEGLWAALAQWSGDVGTFYHAPLVARRRRLRHNPLFPAALQVDCPVAGCWGLGYLGFDTVMCFICEYQWVPDAPGDKPADVAEEDFMGLKVKRCPSCNEAIQKNGGCDHMTCRCRHEFYWTTLKPYRAS
mmetsp:Transcript_79278/g.183983  ORF Transcript_79278/g.183983 Transcript_79278/m.183983 type:complete len:442 (+) Transcript_79278:56-1381(+)